MASNAWSCIPDGCACNCHRIAAGRRASGKKSGPKGLWTKSMDGRLARGLGVGESLTSIAAALHVSISAVRNRVALRGLSLRQSWHSRTDVARLFGVTWRTVERWRVAGAITLSRHDDGRWWRLSDDELRTFIEAHAGLLFDPDRMRIGEYRRLAEVNATANQRRAGVGPWACASCGTSDRPYYCRDKCARCYRRDLMRELRARRSA